MVRRLSFINTFNQVNAFHLKMLSVVRFDAVTNTVFYLRRPKLFFYTFITRHHYRRKAWVRRKHRLEYVLYLTVLNGWAVEYAFMKKMIKFNYNYCITKTSLLVSNLALLRSMNPSIANNSEHVYLTSLPKEIIRYFLKLQYNFHTYWRQKTDSLMVFSSYYQNITTFDFGEREVRRRCLIKPNLIYSTSSIAPISEKPYFKPLDSWSNLLDVILPDYHYSILVEIYKLHILITIILLYKNII